jgi:hypothetical protein
VFIAERSARITNGNAPNHQRDHAGMVAVLLALYVGKLRTRGYDISSDDENSLLWTASYHDADRSHDLHDPYHGERIATALDQDTDNKFGVPHSLREIVSRIIREHVPDDNSQMHPLSGYFKDIDNMFWIRSKDFRHQYLRYPESFEMLPIAHALHAVTPLAFQFTDDGYKAAMLSGRSLGLLR